MSRTMVIAAAMLLLSPAAVGQTMYRCQDGTKVIYSDRPCYTGVEVKRLAPSGGPTREELAKARMKAKVEEDKQRQDERAQRALAKERALTADGTLPAKRVAGVPPAGGK